MIRYRMLVCCFAALSCGPDIFGGDPADVAFDFEIVCSCNACAPEPASLEEWKHLWDEWRLWDVTLAFGDQPPSQVETERLREAGALIVHQFNVPMVRVVMRAEELRRAGLHPPVMRGVTDPEEYVVEAEVRFTSDDSTGQAAVLDTLAARIHSARRRLGTWELIWQVAVADSLIPALRAREDIKLVGLPAFGCLAGGG